MRTGLSPCRCILAGLALDDHALQCHHAFAIPVSASGALFSIAAITCLVPMRSCKDYSARLPEPGCASARAARCATCKPARCWGVPSGAENVTPRQTRVARAGAGRHSWRRNVVQCAGVPLDLPGPGRADFAGMAIHWRFIPTLNPDGMFAKPARRVNAHGVDLNRNFPRPTGPRESPCFWEVRAPDHVVGRAASPVGTRDALSPRSRWTVSSPTSL